MDDFNWRRRGDGGVAGRGAARDRWAAGRQRRCSGPGGAGRGGAERGGDGHMAWPGAAGERATREAPRGARRGAARSCSLSWPIIRRRGKHPHPRTRARGGLTTEVTRASRGILLHNNLCFPAPPRQPRPAPTPCHSACVDTARYAKDLVIVPGRRSLCLAGGAGRGAE